jgi:hypothetical protein
MGVATDDAATTQSMGLFDKNWQTYSKVVALNYMFHREVRPGAKALGRSDTAVVFILGSRLWDASYSRRASPALPSLRIADALVQLPFYHPTFEEGLKTALR